MAGRRASHQLAGPATASRGGSGAGPQRQTPDAESRTRRRHQDSEE